MAWIQYNPNPQGKQVGDCAVRAISKATDRPWEDAYSALAIQGLMMRDMPNANHIWGAYLKSKGFKKYMIPDDYPDCYTLNDFCLDHPNGMYVVALHNHVVAVHDGDYYDSWQSGNETPLYYWHKE